MHRFAELNLDKDSTLYALEDNIFKNIDPKGRVVVGGKINPLVQFRVMGALIRYNAFYDRGMDFEETILFLDNKFDKKYDRYITLGHKTSLETNGAALNYLGAYMRVYGSSPTNEIRVQNLIRGISHFISNGPVIGASFESGITLIPSPELFPEKLSYVVICLGRAAVDFKAVPSVGSLLTFAVDKAYMLEGTQKEAVLYGACIALQRRIVKDENKNRFVRIVMESVDDILKSGKMNFFTMEAFCEFVDMVDTMGGQIDSLYQMTIHKYKEKVIALLCEKFYKLLGRVSRAATMENTFPLLSQDSEMIYTVMAYDALRSLSPETVMIDKLRDCGPLRQILNGCNLHENVQENIIKEIAKCLK